MTSLTATPDIAQASVLLTAVPSLNARITRVERTDLNGVHEVRLPAYKLPAEATVHLWDYEAAHGVNTYTAYVTDVATRTNLSTNPSPAVGTKWNTSFGVDGAGTVSYGTVTGFPSANGSTTTFTTAPTGAWNVNTGTFSGITAGEAVTASLYGKVSWTGSKACLTFQFLDAANVSLGYYGVPQQVIPANTVTRLTQTMVAPAGATQVVIFWDDQGAGTKPPVNGTAIFGAALIEKSSVLGAYFDGATPAVTDVAYAWTGTANASTSTETTTTARQVSASATMTISQPWLFVPVLPHLSVSVAQITTFQASRSSSTVLHRVPDRADYAVKMGVLGLREGQLDVWCPDYATTRVIDAAVASEQTLMLRSTTPGLDMWFVVSDVDVAPISEEGAATQWRYTLRYHETLRPSGELKSARGRTFAELAESFPTFNHVTAVYASFNDLQISKEI